MKLLGSIAISLNMKKLSLFLLTSIFAASCSVNKRGVTRGLADNDPDRAVIQIHNASSYDFGVVSVGDLKTTALIVSNQGNETAFDLNNFSVDSPFSFYGGSFPGTGGTCVSELEADENCTIVLQFSPSDEGVYEEELVLNYRSGLNSEVVESVLLSGEGGVAEIVISGSDPFSFGAVAVGGTSSLPLTLTNSGAANATALADQGGLSAPYQYLGGSYPGTGGTCTTSLAAAASCTVVVQFSPSALGVAGDTLELSYNNGLTAQNLVRNLTGSGALAVLSISENPSYDFGNVLVGSTASRSFVITNSGGLAASSLADAGGLALPFRYLGASYPGTGGNCSTTLAASAQCTVVVEFVPTAATPYSDTLALTYHDGQQSQNLNRDLDGEGVIGAVTISDGATFDYGDVAVNATEEKTFTVSNTGGYPISSLADAGELAAPFAYKGGSYPGTGGTCDTTIAASGSCTVVVEFTPTAAQAYSDTLELDYNNGSSNQVATRAIEGEGVVAALSISDSGYNYGIVAVGSTGSKTFTVSNTGSTQATSLADGAGLAAPFSFKGGTYPGTGGDCGTTLNASENCTIVVDFDPTATGLASDTIVLSYDSGSGAQTVSRAIQGTGGLAVLSISDGATYDYGSVVVGQLGSKTFTVSNTGNLQATSVADGAGLAAPFAYKGGSYPGTGGNCGATLNASDTCTVVVDFSPSAGGAASDTLVINYNDGEQAQSASRAIEGTGTLAVLEISDGATYDYGSVLVGQVGSKTFTVSNTGNLQATSLADGGGLAAPFAYKDGSYPGTGGDCGTTLNASASCTLVVDFSPSAGGAASDTLTLNYNDGQQAQTASRAIEGTGTLAVLAISDGATYDYGTVTIGQTGSKSFTITNNGNIQATSLADAGGLAAPFDFKDGTYPGTGGNCSTTLNASASCTIVVDYVPSAAVLSSDTIEVSYNNGTGSTSATRAIQGTGTAGGGGDGSTEILPEEPNTLPDLIGWWKADAIGGADGDTISSWVDSSGTTAPLVQGTSSRRPTLQTIEINGLPVVRFDGSNDFMEVTAAGFYTAAQSRSAVTMLVVAKRSSAKTQYFLAGHRSDKNTDVLRFGLNADDSANVRTETTVTNFTLDSAPSAFSYYTVEMEEAGAVKVWQNGALVFDGAADSGFDLADLGSFSIGQEWDGGSASDFLNGDVAEVIFYGAKLSESDRLGVWEYIADKYGFTSQSIGPVSKDHSVLTVASSRISSTSTTTVTLQAKDANGNNQIEGGVTVTMTLLTDGTAGGSLGAVTDNNDGTYTATFTASSVGTARTISATVAGQTLTTTLPTIAVENPPLPSDFTGLVAWLKADELGLSNGASVDTWTDDSGVLNHATASGSARPTFITNAVNGLPVLRFNGSSNYMEANGVATDLSSGTSMTILYVVKKTGSSQGYVSQLSQGTIEYDVARFGFATGNTLRIRTEPITAEYHDATGDAVDQFRVYSATVNSTEVKMWQNGSLKISDATDPSYNMSLAQYYSIGQEWDGAGMPSDFFDGDIAEILVFDSVLNTVDRQDLEFYLGDKYNLGVVQE